MSSKIYFWLLIPFYITISPILAQSVGGTTSGSQTYCDSINSGFISVSGHVGNIVTWQYSTDGGTNWINNGNTVTTQSYFNLKQNTCYRAIVKNGAFPEDTSSIACITVFLPSVGGTISGGGIFCGNSGSGNMILSGKTGNVLRWEFSTNNGGSWTPISNTTTTQAFSNITSNRLYWAIVQNGSTCKTDTSSVANFSIVPQTVAGSLSAVSTLTMCHYFNTNTLNLSGNTGNVLNWLFSTNNGSSWSTITNTSTSLNLNNLTQNTWYSAVIQNASCSIDTTNIIKTVILPEIIVDAGTDVVIGIGQSTSLSGSGSGSVSWSPSSSLDNSTILNPVATPIVTTDYILTITDVNSCFNHDTVRVTILPKTFNGIISNVFSPNSDGINDKWYIENIEYYSDNEVTIYNIYGNVVYNKKAYANDWEGTFNGAPLPDGTYFFILKIDNNNPEIKGTIDILRSK